MVRSGVGNMEIVGRYTKSILSIGVNSVLYIRPSVDIMFGVSLTSALDRRIYYPNVVI